MPGFDNENTEDNVCPTLQGSNKFEIWKNLLDLALGDVVYSNWERSAVDSQCCAKVLSDYMQTCKCAALSHRNTFGKLLELDQHVCSGLTGRRPTCGH